MAGKFKIVVSDLHLSAGRESEGNLLEDFASDQDFAAFLADIGAESERDEAEVELIINGDAFEMLQVPHVDGFDPRVFYEPEDYHSSSEEDSVRKMAIIIDGHRSFFDALGRFIRVGPPRRTVTFIKGNHDLNLHWAGVKDQIRQAVGATGGREPLLAFEERRISREGIYVEHGNQYGEAVDRVEYMEEPYDHDKPGQLAIPPGSWFVMNVFNQVEREKYWIDGVKPITALVWYALAYDFRFAARAIATLVGALPGIIWDGFLSFEVPQAGALDQDWEDPDRVEELAQRYETDATFRAELNDELARMLSPQPDMPSFDIPAVPSVAEPVEMGDRVQQRVNSSLYEMAVKRASEEQVKLVTFGHTHDAGVEPLPDGGTYVNSGTWTWRADFGGAGKEAWKDLFEHPERFTSDRRLSYVRIDYDEAGQPIGQLLEYKAEMPPPPPPSPTALPSLWERIVNWLRGLVARITGGGDLNEVQP
jgi:UDP-2,3-diacylglucosamine pyrophosphatase LpxH